MKEQNITVAIDMDFLQSFSKLPKHTQKKVSDFVNKFKNNPRAPGIHYEQLSSIDKKLSSVRIDETYRGIVVRQEETGTFLLLWVAHHDDAYQWASRRRCDVNPQTGSIQIYEVQTEETCETLKKDKTTTEQTSLFAMASDHDLLKLGVPEVQLAFVKNLMTKEAFYQAVSVLPRDAYENLNWLAEDIPLHEVLELLETPQKIPQNNNDLAAALQMPTTLKSFVVVDGEDELRKILAAPLENWRVFLHPTQRNIVEKNYSGSAKVLGGAGTGKTVVAMHRAKYLASQCTDNQRVLITTFTANLAADIKANMRKICSTEGLRRMDIIHLDAWVSRFMKESEFSAKPAYGDDIIALWKQAMEIAETDLSFDASFYEDEWNRVAIAQEAVTLEKYLKASRVGRGTRLDRRKRMQIWKVFEAYQNLMKETQIRDINTAMYECTQLLKASKTSPKYAHVIVDEGQDFSDNAYQLIRALAGEPHPNDILIVGDTHQRIYKNHPTLSQCNINVRGRSSTLRINYRTTEEIRKHAFAFLNGSTFDDLDESEDCGDKCRSLTHGEKPAFHDFNHIDDECKFILEEIKKLQTQDIHLTDICIVARTNQRLQEYIRRLTQAGINTYEIKHHIADDRLNDGLRMATMHRVKGLEFKYVFIVSANHGVIPLTSAINHTDDISQRESITSEKCLLYVAMTRAQKGVYVTSYGKKSEFF